MTSDRRQPKRNATFVVSGLLAVVLVYLAYEFVLTVPVSVDGKGTRIAANTKVADLISERQAGGPPGDLISAGDHKVLRKGGGAGGYVLVDGRRLAPDAPIPRSAVVRSIAGSDVVEPIGRRSQSIEPPIRYEGEGPVETVVSTGVPGLRNVYFGTISRETVRTETATVPTPKVVRLSAPPSGAKVVALTFDDGPWPGSTEKILSILERYNVKATFFMLGKQASSKPALAKKVVAAGMALGNHTINHPNLTKLSASAIAKQVQGAESQILAASGARPKYFRPPGGAMNSAVAAELARDDLKLVEWGIDTEDWKKPGVSSIVARCVGGVRPGVVILMHDGGGDRSQTAAALPMVIEQLRAKGYVFVTLDYISELPSRMG